MPRLKDASTDRAAKAAAQKQRAAARVAAKAGQVEQATAPAPVLISAEALAALQAQLASAELLAKRFQRERERRHSLSRLASYVPYPRQREFHTAGGKYRERAMLAGNQIGKTMAGAAEAAMHLTGRYPDWWDGRVFDRAIRAVAGSESAELTRDGVQRLIVGNPRDESAWGTGLLPRDTLVNWTRRNGVSDALDGIVVRWGGDGDVQASHSTLNFKSYDQGRSKWQADTVDWVWFDEEPPMDIYSEGLTRISSTGGMVYSTFTPLLGMSDVCRRFLLEPSPDRISINMTIDDAPHYSAEQREKIIAGYPPHEREARAKGIPTLGSGRIFPITEEEIACEARIFPREFARIRGLDFGYDHPFACVELVHDRDEDIVYVTRAFRQRQSTPVLHAAAIRAWGAEWVPIAWPHDGLAADKGSGDELAAQYRAQHLNMLPERATFPDGGSGVEAGLMLMLDRMQTGRLKVFSHLNDWFGEFRLYHRKDGKVVKEHDDLLSATRYALMMLRFGITEPVKRHRLPPTGSWQAA
jgi:phage terminase large subunit-like protein